MSGKQPDLDPKKIQSKYPALVIQPFTNFPSKQEYQEYLRSLVKTAKHASNSEQTRSFKYNENSMVSHRRSINKQGYKNNTARMSEIRKQLMDLSKQIFSAKEANWSANTSALEVEKKALQNKLSRLEYPELFKNGTGGRRTHKKRRSSHTRKRRSM